MATKAVFVPFGAQCFDNHIRDWLPATLTLRAEPICMAPNTPSMPILLHERSCSLEWITALSTEEVPRVPFCATSDYNVAFNRGLARFTAWGKEFVEVKVAVET
jgi:hypothetical protein